jgi:hypothetical protein
VAGVEARQVALAVQDFITARGYGANILYGPCHRLGLMNMQTQDPRRATLLTILRERRQDIIPATTYGVDRYGHPWMAADPSFVRLLDATDVHEHIFALHRPYYASFGTTDILGVSDPAAVEQRNYRVEKSTHTEYVLHMAKGDLTAHTPRTTACVRSGGTIC